MRRRILSMTTAWLMAAVVTALAAACSSSSGSSGGAETITAPGIHETVTEAIALAPPGATVMLEPGAHTEAIEINRSDIAVVGDPSGSTEIHAPDAESVVISIVDASDVRIEDLTLVGGKSGVYVLGSNRVEISANTVVPSGIRGIDAVMSSVELRGNSVYLDDSPYAIGLRVANSLSRDPSSIVGNHIETRYGYGIAVNFATADVTDNTVVGGTTAIGINEMSVATVAGNVIEGDGRYGILVTDMSTATLDGNSVGEGRPELEVQFHSEVIRKS